jgi:hypothetical protein
MNFAKCLENILDGQKARRREWPDDGTYITMKDSKLVIFTPKDKRIHTLEVSEGDIINEDWYIIQEDKA